MCSRCANPGRLFDLGAEVAGRKVGIPEGHLDVPMAQDLAERLL